MDRDWDAEEAVLWAKTKAAFECLMQFKSATSRVKSRPGEVAARYVA